MYPLIYVMTGFFTLFKYQFKRILSSINKMKNFLYENTYTWCVYMQKKTPIFIWNKKLFEKLLHSKLVYRWGFEFFYCILNFFFFWEINLCKKELQLKRHSPILLRVSMQWKWRINSERRHLIVVLLSF